MSLLIPRLAREGAREIIADARGLALADLGASLPREATVQLAPVGGRPVDDAELRTLRGSVLDVARRHGYPSRRTQSGHLAFDAEAAMVLRRGLDISPNEASGEGVWSYLTCCWLLDIALWRFGSEADERRLYGDVNRNTFRRLWWRAEILADPDDAGRPFRGLGEDELDNIMERPTLARDVRLARMIARVFADAVPSLAEHGLRRMDAMRDLTKRILRLTPFVELRVLNEEELRSTIENEMVRTIAAMLGHEAPSAVTDFTGSPVVSPSVEALDEIASIAAEATVGEIQAGDLSTLALDIARRTGRVTNMMLREMVPTLGPMEAREVFNALVAQGRLEKHGSHRGTHYVLPSGASAYVVPRPGQSVLRRLLDRRR